MADLTFRFPDQMLPQVLDAIAENHGYQATLDDGKPNPVTKRQFGKQQTKKWMIEQYAYGQINKAGQDAVNAKKAQIDTYVRDNVPEDPD